jgi:hypothetical protein
MSSVASINALYQQPIVNPVVTNNWGTVSYRWLSDSATLKNLSRTALLSYSYTGVFNFTATNGFVVTWNHVPFLANQSAEVNAQIILLTDGYFSFFILKYGRMDVKASCAYTATGVFSQLFGSMNSSNVGLNGTYAVAVNNISIN